MKYLKKYNENKLPNDQTVYKIKTYSADEIKSLFADKLDNKLFDELQYDLTRYNDMGYQTNIYIIPYSYNISPDLIYSGEKWLKSMQISNMLDYEYFPYDKIQYMFYIATEEINNQTAKQKVKELTQTVRMKLSAKYTYYKFDKPYELSIAEGDDNTEKAIGYKVTITADLKQIKNP